MKAKKEVMKALRICAADKCESNCPYWDSQKCMQHMHEDAAGTLLLLSLGKQNAEEKVEAMRSMGTPQYPLNEWAKKIHDNAVKHGRWDEERSFGEIVALCHSELLEALEEYRAGRGMVWYACEECKEDPHPCEPKDQWDCVNYNMESNCKYRSKKPEGIAVEMIDCLIRILDWCGKEGIDVDEILARKHEYNKTRPYRHGGKKL